MNDALKFLGTITEKFDVMKRLCFASLGVCAAVCLGGAWFFTSRLGQIERESASRIYLLDEGSVIQAFKAENGAQRDLEVVNHVTRFHELLLNVSPNTETIESNNEAAYALADKCAYNFVQSLKEQQFYTHIIAGNSVQQIHVDSVKINVADYPYRARAYVTRYYIRPASVTKYAVETSCVLTEVPRSMSNPHGLLVSRFVLLKNTEIETRNRK